MHKLQIQLSKIEEVIKENKKLNAERISELTGLSYWTVVSRLNYLKEIGKIKKEISGEKTVWRISNGR